MELSLIAIFLSMLLLALLAAGMWIGLTILLTGAAALAWFTGAPVGRMAVTSIWGNSTDWAFTALPMFVWMGEILFRTRISDSLFKGLAPWLGRVPGRLLHVNVLGCAIFSAVSGSATATCATVSRISLPELRRRGYPEPIAIGSLASASTLGILIPPSIIMIVYAVAADVSILHMFIAGVIPGLMIGTLFSTYIAIWSIPNKKKIPGGDGTLTLADSLRAMKDIAPCVLLVIGVVAGMFTGIATATEIGALGVVGALVVAGFMRTLTWRSFVDSAYGALRTTCMIGLILQGASVLSISMALTGIPTALAEWVATLQLHPYTLITVLCAIYLLLGIVLEGVAMILLTTSIALPMIVTAGFDPIWFGIFIIVMTELSSLSPPVGFNLFVMQMISGRGMAYVAWSALPFFLLLILSVAIFAVFPEVVTWLPHKVLSR